MFFLIFSMLFAVTTTSTDVVNHLKESVFGPSNTPFKVTRTHLNAQNEELFKEYIYKEDNKIRIDIDFGDSTITSFVYNGKTGYKVNLIPLEEKVSILSGVESLEMILYGCNRGYLSTMEETADSYYNGRDAILATGRQGNKLYLDYGTHLPLRFEWLNEVVDFEKYNEIDGLGKVPFLIEISDENGLIETIKITDRERGVVLPVNFFSVPKQLGEETSEYKEE